MIFNEIFTKINILYILNLKNLFVCIGSDSRHTKDTKSLKNTKSDIDSKLRSSNNTSSNVF